MDPPRSGRLTKWARISFKSAKSRGKVTYKFRFMLEGTPIPSISEKPVKNLRKLFDYSLFDSISELETWLNKIGLTITWAFPFHLFFAYSNTSYKSD
ncbi:reverse transcriptase [Labeo rohita]|uniref:Reverse transcriptase n=1 Tax=Labeo rohita TaxID=84645 RepID=A0A498MGJ5_LABRO|nr:reverse transcriptase [Labeo rohita]